MITYKDLTVVPCDEGISSKDSQRVKFYVGDPFSNEWKDDFAVQVLEFLPSNEMTEVILDDDTIGHLFRKSTFWYADKELSAVLGKTNYETKYSEDFVRTAKQITRELCPMFEEIVNRRRKQGH